MPGVFKPAYSKLVPATGQRKKWRAKVWYARYFDHVKRRWRKRKGYPDRATTLQLACRLERETAAAREGTGPDPDGDAPDLGKHLARYVATLAADGSGEKHVALVRRDVERAAAGCGWTRLADLDGDGLTAWLLGREKGEAISARTWNRVRGSVRAFARWLVRRKRVAGHPFDDVPTRNQAADRRRVRRAIAPAEAERLIAAAAASAVELWGLTGRDRAWLYTVAIFTGYRLGELASLTPESFDLDAASPAVWVGGRAEKVARGGGQPLHPALVPGLRAYLAGAPAGRPVWPGRWRVRGAAMVRVDLAVAGVPEKDARGRVFDFHATRKQYVSTLALAGVVPAVLRELARHSTIDLTLQVYTDLGLDARTEAVGRLVPPACVTGCVESVSPGVSLEESGGVGEESAARASGRPGRAKAKTRETP